MHYILFPQRMREKCPHTEPHGGIHPLLRELLSTLSRHIALQVACPSGDREERRGKPHPEARQAGRREPFILLM